MQLTSPLFFSDRIDRNEIPRMPWHDVGCVVTGSIVSDFARHFIQRWNASRVKSQLPSLKLPLFNSNPLRLHGIS